MIVEDAATATRAALANVGQQITLKRTGTSATALGRITGYAPDELIQGGTVQQGDRKVIVMADDLATFVPKKGDIVQANGIQATIQSVDGDTRRIAGVLIAYEIQARG